MKRLSVLSPYFGGFSVEKEVDTVRISRKLYFPADEVSRKRNFPTIPQTSTLLFRRSAFYSCLRYITAPLSLRTSRSFRFNSAFSVIYTSQPPPPFLVPPSHIHSIVCLHSHLFTSGRLHRKRSRSLPGYRGRSSGSQATVAGVMSW